MRKTKLGLVLAAGLAVCYWMGESALWLGFLFFVYLLACYWQSKLEKKGRGRGKGKYERF